MAAAGGSSASSKATGTGAATPGKACSKHRGVLMRHVFVHTVIEDHSCAAYDEIHDNETAATAIGVLQRAVSWFADRGITVQRVLSDNGSADKSHAWRDACMGLHITAKRPVPIARKPTARSNGSTEPSPTAGPSAATATNESARRAALPAWLHFYNHHDPRHRQAPAHQ
ncbi:hypothetical protein GCM10025881_10760 [Pseudolysinimonas kribbensis]|uniref:Integrase catalytic domain-containing protein n=1 Tax=Pseudolysinimonas kribbensis TaxID=433641 RepID=A0ABQ6K2U4_9MICO|nr:hypothetical protein GCM10025881_10760 [Pseudolysinimonas kribbensis]